MTRDDEAAARRVAAALDSFGAERVDQVEPGTASGGFGVFGAIWDVPVVMSEIGGIDADKFEAAERAGTLDTPPAKHAPDFAPGTYLTCVPASTPCPLRRAPSWR